MRNKIATMLFVVASFAALAHTRLEAVSAVPSQLCIGVTLGTGNTTILSTNTLSTVLDGDLSATAGTDEQLIGFVEFNVSKGATTPAAYKLSQNEPQPADLPASNNWPLLLLGQTPTTSTSDVLSKWFAMKIYSNVSAGTTGTTFVYQSPQALVNASGKGTIVSNNTNLWSNQIGILSFYAIDDGGNSTTDGVYEGTFLFIFEA